MPDSKHTTPEQFWDSLTAYLQEHYPHIDVDSIYPISVDYGDLDDPTKNPKIAVTFNYDYYKTD